MGLVLGPIAGHFAADLAGRKAAMYLSVVFLLIVSRLAGLLLTRQGASIEITSKVWWQWIIAKLFTGAGVSVVSAVLPVVRPFYTLRFGTWLMIIFYSTSMNRPRCKSEGFCWSPTACKRSRSHPKLTQQVV